MQLEYTEGCIYNSINIDGVESIDINDFKKVIHQLIDRESDLAVLQSTFKDCLLSQGICKYDQCDCCNDTILNCKLEI